MYFLPFSVHLSLILLMYQSAFVASYKVEENEGSLTDLNLGKGVQ